MDITMYVGIGLAIGSAIGGGAAALVSVRKQKYTQAKDEFKTLLVELKEDRDKSNDRIDKLEKKLDECKQDHLRDRAELEQLKRSLNK